MLQSLFDVLGGYMRPKSEARPQIRQSRGQSAALKAVQVFAAGVALAGAYVPPGDSLHGVGAQIQAQQRSSYKKFQLHALAA